MLIKFYSLQIPLNLTVQFCSVITKCLGDDRGVAIIKRFSSDHRKEADDII